MKYLYHKYNKYKGRKETHRERGGAKEILHIMYNAKVKNSVIDPVSIKPHQRGQLKPLKERNQQLSAISKFPNNA